jgi:opacity protein-like surface antigen
MINKTKLALGIATALTLTGVLVTPQAMAKSHKAKHHTVTESSSSYSQSTSTHSNSKVDALEAQLQNMQAEINSLRAQANRPVSSAEAGKVQELDQWMNSVKSAPKESKKSNDNMLYFRGGYSGNDASMVATTNFIGGTNGSAATGTSGHSGGWNFGAGIDFNLNDNLFGLMDKTNLLGELDINYVDLGTFQGNVTGNALGTTTASQSMLRITAAPKIKFLNGSKIRPWIIPVGFTLNVISPPSQANAITELKPAMHFGTGVDYNIWKSLYVGADVRYNLAVNSLDGTNVNGLTAGGTLGFGF